MEKPIKDKVYFYDTNAILDLQDKAFENYFYISSVTLEELEHIKTSKNKDDEVKYLARKALHLLDERMDSYECIVYDSHIEDIINNTSIEITPDSKIVACCYYARKKLVNNLVFYTNDISCKMIAKQIFGLPVESNPAGNGQDEYIYKGYKEITGNTQYINQYMENIDLSQWHINEYLIIRNTDDNSEKEMRFDGEKFVALKLPPSRYIKAKNSLQRCALDILNNPDITIAAILGGMAAGKLSFQCRWLYTMYKKKDVRVKFLASENSPAKAKKLEHFPEIWKIKLEGSLIP